MFNFFKSKPKQNNPIVSETPVINLQSKTKPLQATISTYQFENPKIGLEKTLFHKIEIPLEEFTSGLSWETGAIKTKIVIDWLKLNLANSSDLDNLQISSEKYPDAEASIYLGPAHNPCDIINLTIKKLGEKLYELNGELYVNFEFESVAQSEKFKFICEAEFL